MVGSVAEISSKYGFAGSGLGDIDTMLYRSSALLPQSRSVATKWSIAVGGSLFSATVIVFAFEGKKTGSLSFTSLTRIVA